MSFKNGVLEASGLEFGGPGPRFWRVRASFFRDLGPLGEKNAGTNFELEAEAAQFQLGARVGCSSLDFRGRDLPQEWVAGGVPPPGGLSMELLRNASADDEVAYF